MDWTPIFRPLGDPIAFSEFGDTAMAGSESIADIAAYEPHRKPSRMNSLRFIQISISNLDVEPH